MNNIRIFPKIYIYILFIFMFLGKPRLEELFIGFLFIRSFLKKQVKINIKILLLLIIFLTASLIINIYSGYLSIRYFEQAAIILVCYLSYLTLVNKSTNQEYLNIYLKVSYWVAILGIIQFIVYLVLHFDIFFFINNKEIPIYNDYFMRIRSICDEPGWLAQILLPAVLYNIEIKDWKKASILFITFFLTFGTGAYIGFILYFILKVFSRKSSFIKKIITLSVIGTFGVLSSPIWNNRVLNVIEYLFYINELDFNSLSINLSSFSILSNLHVALNNNNLLFGTGLGSHEQSYINNFIYTKSIGYGLNSVDAYSLVIRIMSEFGILSLIVCIIFLFIKYNSKSVINMILLSTIITYLLRGGSYTRFGIVFFIVMYINSRERGIIGEKKN